LDDTGIFVPAEDLLIRHQLRLEALFKKLGAGERELVMQFAEGLMGLRSGSSDFFYDDENDDEFDEHDFSGGVQELGHIDPLAWHPTKSIHSRSVTI
jgi:hypothetical protein